MADVKWTKEQQDAIYDSKSNILVAAAAGSGKTAVLVERIINKVINENVDIDKILVVTFTNAAASEMRERILEAIYKKMEEFPDNKNLQRQLTLINKASICTIDSFCLDIIRNNFFETNLSANFRVADTTEVELLKQEVIDDIFENKYTKNDENFLKLINTYTTYIDDEPLKNLILKIYGYIQSSPFPEVWLNEAVEKFNVKKTENFADTSWGKILLESLKENLQDFVLRLKKVERNLMKDEELLKYKVVIGQDIVNLEYFIENTTSWDKCNEIANTKLFDTWPTDRKLQSELKDTSKAVRDSVRKKCTDAIANVKEYSSVEAYENIYSMYDILKSVQSIVLEFSEKFAAKKREKNIVDFNDIEHYALKILVKRNEDGTIEQTNIADKYKSKFEEIAIDEYQDSNYVQEYILTSVSRGNNVFMVGDVKQSIYKFRQACPDLFLEKYNRYHLKKDGIIVGQKIQLFKNFRSRANILDVTNVIFENIMSEKLGDIEYNENEFLNLGAEYKTPEDENIKNYAGKTELHVIDLKEPEINVFKSDEDNSDEDESDEDRIEDVVLEARYTANNIKKLLNSDYKVFDKKTKEYRAVTYKDIVVLLRATSVTAPIYESEIAKLNIPVFSDVSSEYLESMEIQTIMSVLKIIDNPMQDIPLITVLRSSIAGFTDNELVKIRLKNKKQNFYNSLKEYCEDEQLEKKIKIFLGNLKRWQSQQQYMALDELIWQIYVDTGFYNYVTLMPNGALRQANLKMLFERAKQYESASFKGLFNFINFIDKLHTSSGDLSSAKLIGENENVVRIMSIHKSKGLEFPIVYLCGTGKQFNMQDLNRNILLHQELGIGPKYINKERFIEYDTLAKEAIKIKSKVEALSEEMRVLYVALTRAKEKLIITGISKDWDKSYNEKTDLIDAYKGSMNKNINPAVLKRYKTYLDWIMLVYLNNKDTIKDYIELHTLKKQEIIKEFSEESNNVQERDIIEELNKKQKQLKNEDMEVVYKNMTWVYNYANSVTVPTKTSVTKVKELANGENIVSLEDITEIEESKSEIARPKFLNEEQSITSAQRGTLMHLCFQRLDHTREYTKADIESFVRDMVDRKIITELEGKNINISKILEYTKSVLWQDLKRAKSVHKEQPFYINLKSGEVYNDDSNEDILVQGIIDLYYVNSNDEIILVDYKTDWVQEGQEFTLVDKYKKQLEIYSSALEKSLEKEVSKKYIYSVRLNKMIEC